MLFSFPYRPLHYFNSSCLFIGWLVYFLSLTRMWSLWKETHCLAHGSLPITQNSDTNIVDTELDSSVGWMHACSFSFPLSYSSLYPPQFGGHLIIHSSSKTVSPRSLVTPELPCLTHNPVFILLEYQDAFNNAYHSLFLETLSLPWTSILSWFTLVICLSCAQW